MGISGGLEDEYVVAGYLQESGSFIWSSGQGTGEIKMIPVCGDFNPFCDFEIAGGKDALKVAETFAKQGYTGFQVQVGAEISSVLADARQPRISGRAN